MNHKKVQETLLGIIFLILGGFGVYYGANCWRVYSSSSGWTKTPASVEELKLLEHRKKGDITGYSIVITYRYRFDGREFLSSRFNPADSADYSPGREVRMVYDPLKKAAQSNSPIEILVDPRAPQEAIVVRVFTARIVEAILLGILGMVVGGWFLWSSYMKAG